MPHDFPIDGSQLAKIKVDSLHHKINRVEAVGLTTSNFQLYFKNYDFCECEIWSNFMNIWYFVKGTRFHIFIFTFFHTC